MAIHFVTGRPGAGKSFYTMKLLVEELRGTERKIVTNLAVLREELAEYLHEKFSDTFDILNRLVIIEDDDIEFFYCHRSAGAALKLELDKKGRPESFDIAGASEGGGVFYILDEVHLAFGARNWQRMGQACTFYSSQHRKLGDDVILITQAPKMVDTTFRNLAQDYTVLRNHAMEKLFFFRQPKFFSRQTFMNLPTPNEKPLEKSVFKMDLKVASCYDTAQGIGIHERGQAADKGDDKRGGLHWGWLIPIGLLLMGGLAMIPTMCGRVVSEQIVGTGSIAADFLDGNKSNTNINAVVESAMGTNISPILEVFVPEPEVVDSDIERSMIAGFYTKGKGENWEMVVLLESGEKLSFLSGDISAISSTHVEGIDGINHYFKRPINVIKLRGIRD